MKTQKEIFDVFSASTKAQESQKRYDTIFKSNMIGILITNQSGEIIEANDYFLSMLGYTKEDLKQGQLSWLRLTTPEDREKSREVVSRLAKKISSIETFEKQYIHKNGSLIDAIVCSTCYKNGTFLTLVLNLSTRKKVEQDLEEAKVTLEQRVEERTRDLRRSQAFFEAVFENIPNMIFVKEAQDLRFIRFNKAGEELIGVPRSEMIGKNDYDYFPKTQADFFTQKDREVLQNKRILDIPEETLNTASGPRYLHTRKIPILDQDGKPEYLLGLSEDITEKKQAEAQKLTLFREQMARENAEFRATQFNFLSDISSALTESFDLPRTLKSFTDKTVLFLADACAVVLLNDELTKISRIEFSSDSTMKKDVVDKLRQKYPFSEEIFNDLSQILQTGESELYRNIKFDNFGEKEANQNNQDSSVIPTLLIVSIKFHHQQPFGYVAFMIQEGSKKNEEIDVSLAEEACRRLAATIENLRLYKKTQEASQAKSDFLANVSHEIRTPLGAILGFAELLLESDSDDDDKRKKIETILRNGQQLLGMVNEILDISKIESNKIQIEVVVFSPQQLLDDVLNLLKNKADEKGLILQINVKNIPQLIKSDPTRLRQILINIIENAIKFTLKGKIEITVNQVPLEEDKSKFKLEFHIRDTGIGIKPEQVKKLFQPFSQADSSTTRRFGGTGLGLSLARNLARLMGGDVVLKSSTSNQGSYFLVTITCQKVEGHISEIKPTEEVGVKARPDKFEDIDRILVVDDSSDNRVLLQHYLTKLGIELEKIDFAENGLEGLKKAFEKQYDLILLDIQMPVMDGFQTLERLRQSKYSSYVVALTAHAMKGYFETCLEAGFDDYLQKPLNRETLRNILFKASTQAHYSRPEIRH